MGDEAEEITRSTKFSTMEPFSTQIVSMIGYRVLPVRRRVWRWEVFDRDNHVLETQQSVGSKARAIGLATSAARKWQNKNPRLYQQAQRVIIAMQHTAKGKPKIVNKCALPLTSVRPVDLVVREMAVIAFPDGRATLLERGPGASSK
jgi:hypothetical protein